jgi:hypothetical protein
MDQRIQRYVIPATIVLMTAVLTVWVGAQPANPQFSWWQKIFELGNTGIISTVITIAITNLGLGFVCNMIFYVVMFSWPKERFVDTSRLLQAFGLDDSTNDSIQLRNALMGELHLRLHSHAQTSLLEHFTRRNSGYYIAKTSAIAVIAGLVLAIIILVKERDFIEINCPGFIIVLISLLIFAGASWRVGTQWNREFWEVVWNWLPRDRVENPLTEPWRTLC